MEPAAPIGTETVAPACRLATPATQKPAARPRHIFARMDSVPERRRHVRAGAERWMPLPSDLIYRCLADYEAHHPRFLPPAFRNYAVEAGGYGAGTIIAFDTKLSGQSRFFRGVVAEPEPGRVLEEH